MSDQGAGGAGAGADRPRVRRRWRDEPLVHFVLLGAALFLVEREVSRGHRRDEGAEPIVVTADFVQGLEAEELRRSHRPLSPADREAAVSRFIQSEALYREARALSLDRGDPIVRRRLVQKMQFLLEGAAVLPEPDDATLEAFLQEHADRYRLPPKTTFTHVFFSRDRRGAAEAARDAAEVLAALRAERSPPERAPERGDPFLLQYDFRTKSRAEVEETFGPDFALAIEALPEGRWEGPVTSTYGAHLVRISARIPGRLPTLAEIHEVVLRDWERATRDREVAEAIAEIVARYPVVREDRDGMEGP